LTRPTSMIVTRPPTLEYARTKKGGVSTGQVAPLHQLGAQQHICQCERCTHMNRWQAERLPSHNRVQHNSSTSMTCAAVAIKSSSRGSRFNESAGVLLGSSSRGTQAAGTRWHHNYLRPTHVLHPFRSVPALQHSINQVPNPGPKPKIPAWWVRSDARPAPIFTPLQPGPLRPTKAAP
jgi:hypothetical protein